MLFQLCLETQSRQSSKLFLKSSELGLPQSLTRRRVCPPFGTGGRGQTRWRERGWESPNSDGGTRTLWYSLYICTLCLEISISLKSRNLLQFLQCISVHCKGEREENLMENHTPFPMVKEIHTETSNLRTLKIMPRNLKEIARS